jgi:formylglycine-generating enzyme required for sulfatase activity/serine/threonine protein kinase/Leucine-rich repeat (LRR) protein
MANDLASVVKQLADSGIVAPGKLENFVPPKAHPKSVEELVAELVKQSCLTPFQAQQVKLGKAKALILGAYTILDRIGAGGMGQVFKAEHRKMHRLVAIKMLPPAMMKDAAAIARFEREVTAAAKLRHPNIVAADDAAEANGVHFLVMEYVEGKDLSALVKKDGPLPVGKAVNYILQAARGLEFAHGEGVVHRDIKPANLLVDKKGVLKILDMGLARIEQADGGVQSELTGTGTIMGTVDYMSPEQALNTRDADQRADIYSLGMSLYYLLAGKAAYSGDTAMQKLMAHQNQPIPSLQEVQTTVSKQLDAVFRKMVAKRIEERYQTMSEVVEALEGLGVGSSTTGGKGELASTLDLSSADRKKLAAKATKKPLGSLTEVVASEKTKYLFAKIVGGSFGTIVAPILVFYLIRHLEKQEQPTNPPANPPSATAPAATVQPMAVATNTTTQPPRIEDDVLPKPMKAPFDAAQAKAGQAAWAKHLHKQVETINSVGLRMTLIPPGEFMMGSTPEQVAAAKKIGEDDKLKADKYFQRLIEEIPQHRVTLTQPFLIGSTEVTVGQFRKFVEAAKYATEAEQGGHGRSDDAEEANKGKSWKSPAYVVTDDAPVTQITWNDAAAYCAWLSEQERRLPYYRPNGKGGWLIAAHADGYRLPTEAEWEYACRAGTTTQYSFGDDESQLEQYAVFNKNAGGKAQPVALKRPNPFGLFDMHGNAAEWCQDWYDGKWYEKSSPSDPIGPGPGPERVLRGGNWYNHASYCCSACRNEQRGVAAYRHYGVRIVRPLDPTTTEAGIATTAMTRAIAPAAPTKPWQTPAFLQWVKDVQALPAEKQVEAVSKKLMELNPAFDGRLTSFDGRKTPTIENGVVTGLALRTHSVTDISPLRALVGLTTLSCVGSGGGEQRMLPTLSPLEGMRLQNLNCSATMVSDLSPLAGMPLTELKCGATLVSDLTPLQGMQLLYLACNDTQVSNVSPLETCKSLKVFRISQTKVTPAQVAALQKALPNCKIEWDDPAKAAAAQQSKPWETPEFQQWVKATQALPAEQQVAVVQAKLLELNPKYNGKGVPKIVAGVVTEFELPNAGIADISPLRAFSKLKSLRTDGKNAISDLSPLQSLPLATLRCMQNPISDLSPLEDCETLKNLNVTRTKVTPATVAALQKALPNCKIEWDDPAKATAKKLAYLDPAFQAWVKATQALPAEQQIEAVGKKLMELNPGFDGKLAGTDDVNPPAKGNGIEEGILKTLKFKADHVSDISPVRAMTGLSTLYIHRITLPQNTNFSDMSPLGGMPLLDLHISRTKVADLSPLRNMPLISLYCSDTNVTDLSPLEDCRNLIALRITKTKVTPAQVAALQKALPNCQIEWDGATKLAYLDPAFQAWVKATQALPAEQQIEAISKKLMELNPGFDGKMMGLWPSQTPKIEGGVVTEIRIGTEMITDISPVRALVGLKGLTCGGGLGNGKLSNLSPLHGMALTSLAFYMTDVSDLSPLHGMPLTDLICDRTKVSDLSPLQGMNLKKIAFTPQYISQGIVVVRQMNSLKSIGISGAPKDLLPPDEFWKEYDAGEFGKPTAPAKLAYLDPAFQQWVKATQALPAEKQIAAVSKKLMELNPGFDGKVANANGQGTPKIENGLVTELALYDDSVTDISPVRALAGLKKLGCNGKYNGITAKLSDLTPLQGMELTELSFARTLVSDLSPLSGMPLTNLSCQGTQVSDLSPLKGMNLTHLGCYLTPVSDLSPLESCKSLKTLHVQATKVTPAQIAALQKALPNCVIEGNSPAKAGKPKLAYLDPAFQQWVKATQALPAEKQIEAVSKKLMQLNPGFDGTLRGFEWNHREPKIENSVVTEIGFITDNVTDISPVRALPGLKGLACNGSAPGKGKLSDLMPLEGMKLVGLNCGWSPLISNLGPLAGMQLMTLNCNDTLISELLSLNGMPLTYLRISGTNATPAQVAALQKALPNCYIEWDDPAKAVATQPNQLWNTPAFQAWVKEVQAMPAEEQIEAVGKKLMELNPGFNGKLKGKRGSATPQIENGVVAELYLISDNVADISPLRAFVGLQALVCNGKSKISDLSPLEGLPLANLDCHGTQVSDVSLLERFTGLKLLNVQKTKVTPASVAALQEALPNCRIYWDDPANAATPQPNQP